MVGKFKDLEEAQAAVRELLGHEMTALCMRIDDHEPGTEVVAITPRGVYWMVKFYDDGMVGFGMMSWDLSFVK